MKVVLFCGGLGLRLRDYSETIPKPMVPIGSRPILCHIMRYYAHFGHKDFILCLGWGGEAIKEYFLNYNECMSNDFVLTEGGQKVKLLGSDIEEWRITFVDTGTQSNIGMRLKAVQPYLAGEETFLANYADGLTDLHLPNLINFAPDRRAVARFLSIRPSHSFHSVNVNDDGRVESIQDASQSGVWINGGYFVLRQEIFDYLHDGEELVAEPFHRLIAEGRLAAMKYEGFWGCMDTYKEKQSLDAMHARGESPWEVWKNVQNTDPAPPIHEGLPQPNSASVAS